MKKPLDPYKTIKLNINQILKPDTEKQFSAILEAVYRTHSITREAMFFLKKYLLENPKKVIPQLSENFLDIIMQSVCVQSNKGKSRTNKDLKETLMKYYEEKIKPLHPKSFESPTYKYLNTVLDYAAVSWITMIENNIKQRYVAYVEHYVNFKFNKYKFLDDVKKLEIPTEEKTKMKKQFLYKLKKLVRGLLDVSKESIEFRESKVKETKKSKKSTKNSTKESTKNSKKSKKSKDSKVKKSKDSKVKKSKDSKVKKSKDTTEESSEESKEEIEWIKLNKKIILPGKKCYNENSIYYDIQCSPLDYLLPMLRIMKSIDVSQKENKPKLLNVLPTRHTLIPGHIRIDTTTLIQLTGYKSENLEELKHMVWDKYFLTKKRCFKKKGYIFNNSILTDGVSCCLLFVREDLYGKKFKSKKISKKDRFTEPYLDEIPTENLSNLQGRNVVGIDPNMGNLLYCIDSNDQTLRYTNAKRKVDMRKEKYKKYNEERFTTKIEDKTVKQWEELLSKYDSKTLNRQLYERYLENRFQVDEKLLMFYKNEAFRKLHLHTFRNKKNSEIKFIREFKKTYGPNPVVCIGDWAQKEHRKFKEPVKGKGFRKLFRTFGCELYLLDEHKTSMQCWGCKKEGAILEKFHRREYKTKNGNTKKSELLHGLLKCKTCNRIWNRDANSSRNQRDLAKEHIAGRLRPEYLTISKRKHQIPI